MKFPQLRTGKVHNFVQRPHGPFLWLLDVGKTPPIPLRGGVRAYDSKDEGATPIFEGRFDAEGKLLIKHIPDAAKKLTAYIDSDSVPPNTSLIINYEYGGAVGGKRAISELSTAIRYGSTGLKVQQDGDQSLTEIGEPGNSETSQHCADIDPLVRKNDLADSILLCKAGPFLWIKDRDNKKMDGTWEVFGRITFDQEQLVQISKKLGQGKFDLEGRAPIADIRKAVDEQERIRVKLTDNSSYHIQKGAAIDDGHYLVRSSDKSGRPDEAQLLVAGQFGDGLPDILRHLPGSDTTISVFKWDDDARDGAAFRDINHYFVLMLENRSFDHMLGHNRELREADGTLNPNGEKIGFGNWQFKPDPNNELTSNGKAWLETKDDARDRLLVDPGHEFSHVHWQLVGWDRNVHLADLSEISMGGFINTYLNRLVDRKDNEKFDPDAFTAWSSGDMNRLFFNYTPPLESKNIAHVVMSGFNPENLPVLNGLAKQYAVCDRWFSSMPGPTWPNRLFFHAGTSRGMETSLPNLASMKKWGLDPFVFPRGTIYTVINKFNKEQSALKLGWRIYAETHTPQAVTVFGRGVNRSTLLTGFSGIVWKDDNLRQLEQDVNSKAYEDMNGTFTFIEPNYGGSALPNCDIITDFMDGDSQHPTSGAKRGEKLIKRVYEILHSSKIWKNSVLIITYDEHGGFYDHVPPPHAMIPDSDPNSHANLVNEKFVFDRYGVRVPTVIISPRIPSGVVDHTIYDHTSVTKTFRKRFGIGDYLSDRERMANDFAHLFTLKDSPRTDVPALAVSSIVGTAEETEPRHHPYVLDDLSNLSVPLHGNGAGFLMNAAMLAVANRPDKEEEILKMLNEVVTVGDARAFMVKIQPYLEASPSHGDLRIVVRDECTGLPIESALVAIDGPQCRPGVPTNAAGVAPFTSLPPGNYKVLVSMPGYADTKCSATIVVDTGAGTGSANHIASFGDLQEIIVKLSSRCVCKLSSATDRECMIAIIDKYIGDSGKFVSVTRLPFLESDYTPKKATSCGDVVHELVRLWGGPTTIYFSVKPSQLYRKDDNQSMPQPGDIFIMEPVHKKWTDERAHVGIFYDVRGEAGNFEWRSAEGGQGPMNDQKMWISDTWRGPEPKEGGKQRLLGWRSLDTLTRKREECRRLNQPSKK